ncbi:MAG TPA: phosphotransferase [Acidimicrobiales bacterium]|nr:phosphotransferase [Acidimicrobiales bacterium]
MGLAECVSRWLAKPVRLLRQVFNGEHAEVWQASVEDGQLAVHVSPAWRRPSQLAWCHAVARYAGCRVPAVVVPLESKGSTYTRWRGHLVSAFPWVEGTMANRTDPAQVQGAGALLAEVHAALLDWPTGDRPPNLGRPRAPEVVPDLADAGLDTWWADKAGGLVHGLYHGDYYRRNLLVREGVIQGVIDWDEARPGPLIGEVAFAAWEFGHDHELNLVADQFQRFVDAYRGLARHLPDHEYDLVAGAVRVMLRDNISYALLHGATLNDDYQRRQVRAFWQLGQWLRMQHSGGSSTVEPSVIALGPAATSAGWSTRSRTSGCSTTPSSTT